MADFDTNYWGGGAYTPTDYSMQSAAPNWQAQQVDWQGNYNQPNYYDEYAGYQPNWGSQGAGYDNGWGGWDSSAPVMAEGGDGGFGGLGAIFGKVGDWMGAPSGGEGSASNGSKLLSSAITGGAGALMGIMQSKALEKANKKKAKEDAARIANAGKTAAKQRLDYLEAMRQDPRFREFTVNAPDRNMTANEGSQKGYGQSGGEHQFFDPEYLSKITTTPVPLAEGGLAATAAAAMRPPTPDLGGYIRYLMQGKQMAQPAPQQMARGGLSMVTGEGGGQDDLVDAKLSPGEYVMDAETVSALGDGSSEAGAKKLDKMRQNLRTHKRSAPKTKIPPKAKKPEGYL